MNMSKDTVLSLVWMAFAGLLAFFKATDASHMMVSVPVAVAFAAYMGFYGYRGAPGMDSLKRLVLPLVFVGITIYLYATDVPLAIPLMDGLWGFAVALFPMAFVARLFSSGK